MAGQGCPICAAVGQGDNDFWVAVFTGEFAEVYLERRSRLPGYCIVVWRHGHIAEPADLGRAQAGGYGRKCSPLDARCGSGLIRSS